MGALLAVIVAAAAQLGSFCVDGDCRRVARAPARVSPAITARAFVWMDADQENVVVGTIAANEARVPIAAATTRHEIALRVSDGRKTPVKIELVEPERTWTVSLRVDSESKLTLAHPPCACTVRAHADEYRSATAALANEKEVSLLLRRLPAISGVVVDAVSRAPIAGAEVSLRDAKRSVITADNGAFRLVVDQEWPSSIRVAHPTRAPKLVPVPKAVADVELRPIHLAAGGTIHLAIAPPLGGREPLSWELRTDDKEATLVRSSEIATGVTDVSIESLDPGLFRVLIKGSEPLQRFATKVRVVASAVTDVVVQISPLVVEGEVTFDAAPLASPRIEVRPKSRAWVASIEADGEGRFVEELWQPGEHSISVSREPVVRIWGTDRRLEGDGRMKLELEVPNRRIRGRVTDSRTGAPVGDAFVVARVRFGNGTVAPRSRTAADGSFEFTGIEAGDVTLTAQKTGYRFTRPVDFILGEDETLHEENLLLEELAVKRTLVATDARGIPLVGAAVFAPGLGPDGFARVATTDGEGRATIHLRSAEDRGMLYVVPRSGSIGFAPLAAADAGGVIAVRVLDAASLNLKIESTDGEPIPRVAMIMRINGTPIPPDIAAQMAYMQGLPLTSDASGQLVYPRLPPGQYELWPIASKRDPRDAPPVTVAVLPGPQTVVMKFRPR